MNVTGISDPDSGVQGTDTNVSEQKIFAALENSPLSLEEVRAVASFLKSKGITLHLVEKKANGESVPPAVYAYKIIGNTVNMLLMPCGKEVSLGMPEGILEAEELIMKNVSSGSVSHVKRLICIPTKVPRGKFDIGNLGRATKGEAIHFPRNHENLLVEYQLSNSRERPSLFLVTPGANRAEEIVVGLFAKIIDIASIPNKTYRDIMVALNQMFGAVES